MTVLSSQGVCNQWPGIVEMIRKTIKLIAVPRRVLLPSGNNPMADTDNKGASISKGTI